MEGYKICVVTFLTILPCAVFCNEKRLLVDNPEELDARLKALELTIQDLKSEVSEKNNYVTQLQSHVLNLQSTVSQLEHVNNNQTIQIQNLQTKVNTPKQGCQTGSHTLKDISTNTHAQSAYISFSPPFSEIPKVVWGTSALDVNHEHNIRFNTNITGVTTKGFTVAEATWSDTGLYYVSIRWMACPAHYY